MKYWIRYAAKYLRAIFTVRVQFTVGTPDIPKLVIPELPKQRMVPNPLLRFSRNAHCICGSGKKFKACHLHQLPGMVPPGLAADGAALLKNLERLKIGRKV